VDNGHRNIGCVAKQETSVRNGNRTDVAQLDRAPRLADLDRLTKAPDLSNSENRSAEDAGSSPAVRPSTSAWRSRLIPIKPGRRPLTASLEEVIFISAGKPSSQFYGDAICAARHIPGPRNRVMLPWKAQNG
jgi:hypothetical protein